MLISVMMFLLFAQPAFSKGHSAVATVRTLVEATVAPTGDGVVCAEMLQKNIEVATKTNGVSEDVRDVKELPVDLTVESEKELQLIIDELERRVIDVAKEQNNLRAGIRESGRKAFQTEKDLEKLEDPKLIELRKRLEAAEMECYRIRAEYMQLLNSKPQVQESVKEQQELCANLNANRIESRRLREKLAEAKQRLRQVQRELSKKSEK